MSMADFIAGLHPGYVYPSIFFGHIFLGGLILIPALYLSITQTISLPILFVLIVTSSMFADSFWYSMGKYIKKERAYSLKFIRNRMKEAKKFSEFYERYGVWAVFLTKFIYGTRIASHILAGMHKISFLRFLAATAAGTAAWFTIMFLLIKLLDRGVSDTGSLAFRIQVIFLTMIAVLILFNWFTGSYIRKRLINHRKKR